MPVKPTASLAWLAYKKKPPAGGYKISSARRHLRPATGLAYLPPALRSTLQ